MHGTCVWNSLFWFNYIFFPVFLGDDVIGEFLQDKQEEIEQDKPKIIDTSLPGTTQYSV